MVYGKTSKKLAPYTKFENRRPRKVLYIFLKLGLDMWLKARFRTKVTRREIPRIPSSTGRPISLDPEMTG